MKKKLYKSRKDKKLCGVCGGLAEYLEMDSNIIRLILILLVLFAGVGALAVEKVYLDAPVLDMRTWPPKGSPHRDEVYAEYGLNEETIETFGGHPIENLPEFFSLGLPTLIVAGGADEVVPFEANSGKLIDYCKENGIEITSIVKPECKHHPHSLEDVEPIVDFIEK